MKTKKLLLLCMLSLFIGTQTVSAQCVNLLDEVALTLSDSIYFAPNWNDSNNYSATVDEDENEIDITLTDATYQDWQAQFIFIPDPTVAVTPGETYKISMDVNSSTATAFYVKIILDNDQTFIEIPRTTVQIGDNPLEHIMAVPTGLTSLGKIIFDFGGNPANTVLKINNISICQYAPTEGVNSIVVAPTGKNILTNQELQFTATALNEALQPIDDVNFAWSVNPATASIDEGVFSASAPGEYTITASADEIDGTATVTVYESFECNNLLEGKTLSEASTYFAPGWNASNNYSVSVANDEIEITLGDATWDIWQAQFSDTIVPSIAIIPDKLYKISLNVNANKATPMYVKALLTNDLFFEIGTISQMIALEEGDNYLENLMIAAEGLTEINKILFAFGGNAENTEFKITDITICTKKEGSGIDTNASSFNSISFAQSSGRIQVYSEYDVKTITLYSVNGQTVAKEYGDIINTSNLTQGVYLMNVVDVQGNKASFKVIIK